MKDAIISVQSNEIITLKAREQKYIEYANKVQIQSDNYKEQLHALRNLRRVKFVNVLLSLLPKASKRRLVLRKLAMPVLKYLKACLRIIYFIVPNRLFRYYFNSLHSLLKDQFLQSDNIHYPLVDYIGEIQNDIDDSTQIEGKIGIHLHLFYEDILPEFIDYLSRIPFKFDIYVSVREDVSTRKIKRQLKKIINARKIIVKHTKNIGRDFGPMIVLFGKQLKAYDYILHIHSKKSLRTGSDQSEWRKHMLDGVLGSPAIIGRTLNLLEKHKIGLIYPDTFQDVPYWVHTWLDASSYGQMLCQRLGIDFTDSYLNFSAGSFFWVRGDAVRQLFDLDLGWGDFGEEQGQHGGSLEYAFERIWGLLVEKNNYHYAVWDGNNKTYRLDHADMSFSHNYRPSSIGSMEGIISDFDVVSFDIFDTLISRKVYRPDDVFDLVELGLHEAGIEIENFKYWRKRAEELLRLQDPKKDCDLNDIYESFKNLLDISSETADIAKRLEIEYELALVIPRRDMLDIYNYSLKSNKKIILVSDMYLPKAIIVRMLEKCGFKNWHDIYLSNEYNLRKDNDTMWQAYVEKFSNAKTIHIGDNEESDIHKVLVHQRDYIHVMQARKAFEISQYGKSLIKYIDNRANQKATGLIVNKGIYNSPIFKDGDVNNFQIHSLYEYGYSALGPVFLRFFQWLISDLSNSKRQQDLLFLAREGYLLHKLFKTIKEKSNIDLNHVNDSCVLTSRRASSVASIRNKEDIKYVLEETYNGTVYALFYSRIGILIEGDDFPVSMPRDIDKIQHIIDNFADQILDQAEKERRSYKKYLSNHISNNSKITVVDIGYSGSTQYYLSKLLNRKISGKYFVVSDDLKPLSQGNIVETCFNKSIYEQDLKSNPIYKHSLIFESFLTAPHGQLIYMKEDGEGLNPVFNENNEGSKWEDIMNIYTGVEDYINDYMDLTHGDIITQQLSGDFVLENFQLITEHALENNTELFSDLSIDDMYISNTGVLRVINTVSNP